MIALSLVLTGVSWIIMPLCPKFLSPICAPFAIFRLMPFGLVIVVPAMILITPLAAILSKDRFDGYIPAIVVGLIVSFITALAMSGLDELSLGVVSLFAIFGIIYALLYWIVLYLQATSSGSQS
ncbi:MAG: hypothetical protein ABJF50_12470 [Paracoccaceae bacterium]